MWLTLTMVTMQVSDIAYVWASMSGLKLHNEFKMPKSQSPDYHVFGETQHEVGGARNRTHKALGKALCSIPLLHPNIIVSKLCANLERNVRCKANVFAILWNSKDLAYLH